MNMTADVGSLNKNCLIWSGIMKNFDFEYISELIYKKTVGSISEEEERILQDWMENHQRTGNFTTSFPIHHIFMYNIKNGVS